jgi:hypothetical protein
MTHLAMDTLGLVWVQLVFLKRCTSKSDSSGATSILKPKEIKIYFKQQNKNSTGAANL